MARLIKLNTGYEIPMIGMGISRNIDNLESSVDVALKSGYRLFDTARIYKNEELLGESLKKLLPQHGLKREDLFITTKMPTIDESPAEFAEKHLKESLSRLQVEYLDMVLVHYPRDRDTGKDENREVNKNGRQKVYQVLEKYQKMGLIRSIGVSNFEVYHLKELFEFATIPPAVNQIEYHPYCTKPQVVQFCKENNIFVQAYSSLCWGNEDVYSEKIINELAKKYNVSPQLILYAFGINSGIGIIPKSQTPHRIDDNLNVVRL